MGSVGCQLPIGHHPALAQRRHPVGQAAQQVQLMQHTHEGGLTGLHHTGQRGGPAHQVQALVHVCHAATQLAQTGRRAGR